MTEHQLEKIHNYTKFKVVELLIKKHKLEPLTPRPIIAILNDILFNKPYQKAPLPTL